MAQCQEPRFFGPRARMVNASKKSNNLFLVYALNREVNAAKIWRIFLWSSPLFDRRVKRNFNGDFFASVVSCLQSQKCHEPAQCKFVPAPIIKNVIVRSFVTENKGISQKLKIQV